MQLQSVCHNTLPWRILFSLVPSVAMSSIPWEQQVELCKYFQFERLKQLLAEQPNDVERDVFLTSTFFILDTVVKASYRRTLNWGEFYLDYLATHPEMPVAQRTPRSDILRRMAIIYDVCDMLDRALAICDVAESYGISEDGTRGGFPGRRKRLEARRKAVSTNKT
jgi:hypothetical protein